MLFSKPGYTSIGDPFKSVAVQSLRSNKNEHEIGGHDARFKLTSNPKERLHKAPFEYIPSPPPKRRETRDEDGVIIEPANFKVSPMKKGRTGKSVYFENKIEYIADDYNIGKKIAKEEREYHHSKLQDKPFS